MNREVSGSDSDSKQGEAASDAFKERHKSVFAFDEVKLSAESSDSSERRRCDERDVSERRGSNSDAQDFKGRESIFRVTREEWTDPRRDSRFRHPRSSWTPPGRRPNQGSRSGDRGRMPDFKRNPDKYTKYSLDDAAPVSHESNRQAAFEFLDQLKKRKANDNEEEEEEKASSSSEGQKIAFRKPIAKKLKAAEQEKPSSPSSSSSTGCRGFVLPECVVGERKEKKKAETSFIKQAARGGDVVQKSMTLSHLMEEEEEEEESD